MAAVVAITSEKLHGFRLPLSPFCTRHVCVRVQQRRAEPRPGMDEARMMAHASLSGMASLSQSMSGDMELGGQPMPQHQDIRDEAQTSSSGVNTSSKSFSLSYSSDYSDFGNTDALLSFTSQHKGFLQEGCDSGIASPLPCDAFKYLTWHKLQEHDVQGTQLRCPRVREGPSEDDLFLRGEEHMLKIRRKLTEKEIWQQRLQENWENCMNVNLSFQDLGDPYQQKNFYRILRRLIRVERLWLVDNSLTDLSAIRLPRCKELNVSKNLFTSFKQLPKMPQIQHLSVAENNIETLSGLSDLRSTALETLILKTNPCEFHENYRSQVFSSLPNLKMLDGIPKLAEDYSPANGSFFSNKCIIL